MKRAVLLTLLTAALLLAGSARGKLYNLKTGEVVQVLFKSHFGGNPTFEIRLNTGELITGEMIRGGGPDVIVGSSHTQATGSAVATGPGGTVVANGQGQAQTNSSWVHNPLLRKGNMIGTGPNGLLLRCNYSAQAGLIRGHGSGPCEDNRGGEYTVTF